MDTEHRDATPATIEAELTGTCQEDSLTSKVVTALEHAWAAIRELHSEVPNAVIVVASGTSTRLPRWVTTPRSAGKTATPGSPRSS